MTEGPLRDAGEHSERSHTEARSGVATKRVLQALGLLVLAIPLVIGVAWAGDGRFESWGSALAGLLVLVMVWVTSSSFGIWSSDD